MKPSSRAIALFVSLAAFGHSVASRAHADFGTNLIVDGDAEAGPALTGWTVTGAAQAVSYATGGGFPTSGSPGPADRGKYFFGGGIGAASSLTQTILLTPADIATITSAGATFDLSGYLGGFANQNDHATLTALFRDAGNVSLGSATIGPVLAADRGDVTGLLLRDLMGNLPTATTSIFVTAEFTRDSGSYNDGYADNLSLILTARAVPEPSSLALAGLGGLALFVGRKKLRRARSSRQSTADLHFVPGTLPSFQESRRIMRRFGWMGLLIVGITSSGGIASADMITVANASFEDQALPIRGFIEGTLTGWSAPGIQGPFRPSAHEYPGGGLESAPATGIPDGVNVAYSNGGTISQVLGDTLTTGAYTLLVDIGHRADDAFPGYYVQLLAGGHLLAEDHNAVTVPSGTFATSTVLYTALPGNAFLGEDLQIRLVTPGGIGQTDYDNVRLSVIRSVPEPSSLALLGLGVAGFAGFRFRRRKTATVRELR